jgi:hypothetical protein
LESRMLFLTFDLLDPSLQQASSYLPYQGKYCTAGRTTIPSKQLNAMSALIPNNK